MKKAPSLPKYFSPRNTLFSNLVLKLTPEELAQWDEKDFRKVISSDRDTVREELEDFLPCAVQETLRSEGELTDVIRLFTATTLLGEVGDPGSMDVMLDVLRQDSDFLDMCFGETRFSSICPWHITRSEGNAPKNLGISFQKWSRSLTKRRRSPCPPFSPSSTKSPPGKLKSLPWPVVSHGI